MQNDKRTTIGGAKSNRAAYISGLRKLADLLERHDDIRLPYEGPMKSQPMVVYYLTHSDPAQALRDFAATVPNPQVVEHPDRTTPTVGVLAAVDGLWIEAIAYRKDVTRVITEAAYEPFTLHTPAMTA
jgi:hypothetical protein